MLTDIRDIIIIFGISISFLLLLISTILIVITFLKIRKITKFIENSLSEISDIRKKMIEIAKNEVCINNENCVIHFCT